MKTYKTLTLLLMVFGLSNYSFSQIRPPEEVNVLMSKGMAVGWKILIPLTETNTVEKKWKKFMKDFDSKTSKVKKHDEFLSEQANMPSLSNSSINVYSKIEKSNEDSYLILFFEQDGRFMSSNTHKDKVGEIQKIMMSFAKNLTLESIGEIIDSEEKELKRKKKELDKLVKNKSSYEDEIKKCEGTIEQRKRDIEQNIKDQESQEKQIEEQEKKVKEIAEKQKKFE